VGAPAPPRAVNKIFFRPNLQEKCQVHPQPEQESIFRTVFAWLLRFGRIFRRSLRGRRLKKGSQLFWGKDHPRQNPGYAYAYKIGLKLDYKGSNAVCVSVC